jgi:hypothetical protein
LIFSEKFGGKNQKPQIVSISSRKAMGVSFEKLQIGHEYERPYLNQILKLFISIEIGL